MVNFDFDVANYFYILYLFILIKLVKNQYYKGYFKNVFSQIKKDKKLILISLAIIILVIVFADLKLILFVKGIRENAVIRVISGLGNTLGEGKYLFGGLITFLVIFMFTKRKKLESLMYMALGSTLIVSVMNLILKLIMHRERPKFSYNPYAIFSYAHSIPEGNFFKSAYGSMPSGHVISIASAVFIFAFACKNKVLKAVFYILPFVTALGRMYNQKHWLSDILFSYLIAYVCTKAFYEFNKNKEIN